MYRRYQEGNWRPRRIDMTHNRPDTADCMDTFSIFVWGLLLRLGSMAVGWHVYLLLGFPLQKLGLLWGHIIRDPKVTSPHGKPSAVTLGDWN